jgi:hypothetical protein
LLHRAGFLLGTIIKGTKLLLRSYDDAEKGFNY